MIRPLALFATLAMVTAVASANPPRGPGDKRRIVGILDVHVEGVPPELERQFQSDLEKKLDGRTYWLAPQQRMRELMSNSTKWTEGCVIGPCLHDIRIQTGAEIVLLASITGSGTSFGYVVTLMRTDTGRMLDQDASRCEVCTVNEVLNSATLAAVHLLTGVPDKLPDETSEVAAKLEIATSKLDAERATTRRRSRAMGIVMTVAGVVAAGAGMTLYLALDRPVGALAGAGLGTGLAVGGIATLTF